MTTMPRMQDVLRLVKAGRVAEATGLLRDGLLEPRLADQAPAAEAGLLDLLPPTAPGNPWTASASPDEPTRPGRFAWRSVSTAAGQRRYKLYVPAGSSHAPRPLLLMLHGCTQSPDDFAAGTGMNAVADEFGLLVAYPEQTAAHNASKCWNWFRPGDQRRGGGEASLLAAIPADVARDLSVDATRVFVAGLSAGGAAAAVLAHEYPDVFRAAGVHSGLACGAARDLPSALSAMKNGAPGRAAAAKPVPTITFHGSADRTVAAANARHVLAGAVDGHAPPTIERGRAAGGAAFTRERWRDAAGRPLAEAWTVEGAGHAWSGGSPAGSYTDPRGPDASREMVRFFLDVAAG